MIIRDSRSPKGRYEDSRTSCSTVDRILSMSTGMAVLPEGETWLSLNTRATLARKGPANRRNCAYCGTVFVPGRSWAQYCRTQCQKSARWRRQKGPTHV